MNHGAHVAWTPTAIALASVALLLAGCATEGGESPTMSASATAATSAEPSTTPSEEATVDANAAWEMPSTALPGAVIVAQWPVLRDYGVQGVSGARPSTGDDASIIYDETVIWLEPGEGAALAGDFSTSVPAQPLTLRADWDAAAPADAQTSDALDGAFAVEGTTSLEAGVSPAEDIVVIVSETPAGEASSPVAQ